MYGLDAYIMGTNVRDSDLVLHQCPRCWITKELPMVYELGGWFYVNDDDAYCEYCDTELEIREGAK
jgi:hypothetical protein